MDAVRLQSRPRNGRNDDPKWTIPGEKPRERGDSADRERAETVSPKWTIPGEKPRERGDRSDRAKTKTLRLKWTNLSEKQMRCDCGEGPKHSPPPCLIWLCLPGSERQIQCARWPLSPPNLACMAALNTRPCPARHASLCQPAGWSVCPESARLARVSPCECGPISQDSPSLFLPSNFLTARSISVYKVGLTLEDLS